MARILISALLLMYAGCATAGPEQVPPEYSHIRDFVAKASAAYGMDTPRIVATDWEDRAAIRYQDRQLYVSRKTLSYSDAILEPLLAHELGHHILGHRGSVSPQDEAAANAEAVRILAKLYGGDEGRAFYQVYAWLRNLHRQGYHAKGHFDACTEISMLATVFPAQKAAWAGRECIGS